MTYTRPEVNALGDAARVIQGLTEKVGQDIDEQFRPATPAYDLDE